MLNHETFGVISGSPRLHRQILDAMPVMALIVDEDIRVMDANANAIQEFGNDFKKLRHRRTGDIIPCHHSLEQPGGCGHSVYCGHCPIRNSVKDAHQGNHTVQMRTRIEFITLQGRQEHSFLITAVPISLDQPRKVLLLLEDAQKMLKIINSARKQSS